MTKDKKAITLVSLVITIIVMLIIFGVTITSGTVLLDNSKKTKIETSLLMVKARAEILLEQYMFDGDVKSLISFSRLEKNSKNPKGYSFKNDYFSYTITLNNKEFVLENSEDLKKKVKDEIWNQSEINYSETKEVIDQDGKKKIIPRYLFVKWGWDECVSQGIYKENVDGKFDNDSIVNDNDYIIVLYDLFAGKVDVAYSKGYKANGKIAYTLNSILNIDAIDKNGE